MSELMLKLMNKNPQQSLELHWCHKI